MYKAIGKRLFDLFFSLMGLFFLSPVFLLVPVFIKLDSPGPVFFVQKRMGQAGRPFFLIKFRSMTCDTEQEKKGFEPGSARRITNIGRLLRKSKLDEVPQLINVFLGDMSFVGPRPEVERYKDFYTGKYAGLLGVRPGITDAASIKYRHEEEILAKSDDPQKTYQENILPDKLKIASDYVRSISLKGDIKIIVQTLGVVLQRKV